MPYTEQQHKLFEAAAHDPKIAKEHNLTPAKAGVLAGEGVKDSAPKKIKVRFRKPDVRNDAEHWITLHPNGKESKGTPALINGAGQIIGGAGGKLDGKVIHPKTKSTDRPGTSAQHAPALWLGAAKPEQPGNGGAVTTEPPKEPATEQVNPEGEHDPELRKLQAKLAAATDLHEKSVGMPEFLRKNLEDDVAKHQKAIDDYKAAKSGENKPEVKPEPPKVVPPVAKPPEAPKPEPVPEPEPEPKPEPMPEPKPEPEPEKPADEHPLAKITREGDEMAAKAKTFEDVEAAYKKYREGVDVSLNKGLGGSQEAKDLHDKMMAARQRMSEKSFEISDNAKTLEEHKAAMSIQHRMYELTKYTGMRNAHARAYNDHLKAIKKFASAEKAKAKRAAKAEEKRTGIKPKDAEITERFAKSNPEEISKHFTEKYGMGFTNKPDTKEAMNRRAELYKKMYEPGVTPEEKMKMQYEADTLRQQINSAERYSMVRGFNAVDINGKTQSSKNARKVLGHVDETFDSLEKAGYDMKAMFAMSQVSFASGTTGKYGGLAWGANGGEGPRHFSVHANSYFDDERRARIEEAEASRAAKGMSRWNAGDSIRSTIIHETAHAVGMNKSRQSPQRLAAILQKHFPDRNERQEWIKRNISEYGSKNIHETDAELASKVLNPKYVRGTLPKEFEDHVDWLFMKKGT